MIHRMALTKMNKRFDAAVVESLQAHVVAIRDAVPGLCSYDLVPNTAEGTQGFDWIVLAGFQNQADLDSYRVHPLHLEFVGASAPYTEDFIAVTYERQ